MKKYKVGLVGVGRGTAYGRIFANHPETEVVALCDMNQESLEKNGKDFNLADNCLFENYEDFINADLDIVVLGTPIPFHAEQTIKAMEANKHVLCEVTASNTIESCQKMVEAVRKAKTKFMMAENCNYMHFVMEWDKYIKAGKIGTPFYAEAEYVHEIRTRVNGQWRANRAPLHYCSHSLGPVLKWMDDYVVRCTASGKHHTLEPATDGNIDIQVALFETAKGATIKLLRSSVALRHPALCSYNIIGTKGFLESSRTGYDGAGLRYFEDHDNKEQGAKIGIHTTDIEAPAEATAGGHGSSEFYLVRDFLQSIDNDTTPPIDIVRAMDMTVPGLIAHEAAMKGGVWLDVPRLTD